MGDRTGSNLVAAGEVSVRLYFRCICSAVLVYKFSVIFIFHTQICSMGFIRTLGRCRNNYFLRTMFHTASVKSTMKWFLRSAFVCPCAWVWPRTASLLAWLARRAASPSSLPHFLISYAILAHYIPDNDACSTS